MRIPPLLVAILIIALPGALLGPVWQRGGLGAGEDDILYYFPARALFADALARREWPWINPWTGLGRPIPADPQAAVWYPPTGLFALLPPVTAYPTSLWLHYSLALWGMYRLLRGQGLGRPAASFGAAAFAFSGFMLAHRAHFALQNAAAWTPLVLWRFRQAAARPGVKRLVAAGAVLALQVLSGHVQIAALTALAAAALVLVPERETAGLGVGRPTRVGVWCGACGLAAGLSAVQWLPTLAYLGQTTRVDRTYLDFVENSWHPGSVIGCVLPMLFGQRTPNFFPQPYWGPSHQVEQFAYPGILPLLLAGLALRPGWATDPRRRPWVILGVGGLLLALGQYGPVCPLLYWVPGSSLFRCPARGWLIVNLAIAALAAATFADLGPRLSPDRARLRAAALSWTRRPVVKTALLIGVPVLLVLLGVPLMGPAARSAALEALRPWNPAIWVPCLAGLLSFVTLRIVVRGWRRTGLLALLPLVTLVDLGVIGWTFDVPRGRADALALLLPSVPSPWLDVVRTSGHRLWVVTARDDGTPGEYHDPLDKCVANTSILRGILTLTDYGPLQPRSYVQRFGFQPWGESWKAAELLADTRWMRLYNVGWVLLCDPVWPAPDGCELLLMTSQGWRLYRNPSAAGPAVLEDAGQPGAVRHVVDTPARATTTVADTWPANPSRAAAAERAHWPRLVLSQLHLPGWRVRVNGVAAELERVDGVLMGVRIPPGEVATVEWEYTPPWMAAGATLSVLTLLGLAGIAALGWCRGGSKVAASV